MIEKFRKEEKKLKKPKNKNQEFLFMYKYELFKIFLFFLKEQTLAPFITLK